MSNTRRHCWQKRVIMITARASPALNPYLQNRINQCVAFVLQIDCQSSCSISPSPASIQIELDIFERFWDFCIPALSAAAGVGLQRRESWHRWSIELANSIRLSSNLMWTQVFDEREQFWRWEVYIKLNVNEITLTFLQKPFPQKGCWGSCGYGSCLKHIHFL